MDGFSVKTAGLQRMLAFSLKRQRPIKIILQIRQN